MGNKVILRRIHAELVLEGSMEMTAGRTLSQVGKSVLLHPLQLGQSIWPSPWQTSTILLWHLSLAARESTLQF